MERKYKLLTEEPREYSGRTLYRIEALCDFGDVKTGDKGGWIESYDNLQQEGECWVYDESIVMDKSIIKDRAIVKGTAIVMMNSYISSDSGIIGNVRVVGCSITGKNVLYSASAHGRIDIINTEIRNNCSILTSGNGKGMVFISNAKLCNGVNIISDEFVCIDSTDEVVELNGNIHIRKSCSIHTLKDIYHISLNGEHKHITFYKSGEDKVLVYIGNMGVYDMDSLETEYELYIQNEKYNKSSSDLMTINLIIETVNRHMGRSFYKGKDVKNFDFKKLEKEIEKLDPLPVDTEEIGELLKSQEDEFYRKSALYAE